MSCKLLLVLVCIINAEIINRDVHRRIEFQDQHVKEHINIVMHNNGTESVDQFNYVLDPDVRDFHIQFKDDNDTVYKYLQNNSKPPYTFVIFLHDKIKPNKSLKFIIDVMYFGKITPIQSSLMGSNQYVLYRGNLLFYSHFKTLKLTCTVMLKLSKLVDLEISHDTFRKFEEYIEYVEENIEPFNFTTFKIMYKDRTHFFTVPILKRKIDVSHYGKIVVTDDVTIKNEGRYLCPFPKFVQFSIPEWRYTYLPSSAENIKFFDILGNSSKTQIKFFDNYTQFKFKPRYPIYSGWKTNYIIKYEVPIYNYLFCKWNEYMLVMRAVDHILNDILVKEADVKILLPEGVNIINVKLPEPFERLNNTKHYTMLSTFGRPTIKFKGTNIYENFDDFEVEYSFCKFRLFRVPLVLITYLEFIFVSIILVVHVKEN